MYDQQIHYLSSNQRPTHIVRCLFYEHLYSQVAEIHYTTNVRPTVHTDILMLFRSQKIKQHKTVGVLIICHFLTSQSWRDEWHVSWLNDFISRLSLETKPRARKLANFIDRLTPHLYLRSATCISKWADVSHAVFFCRGCTEEKNNNRR